MKCIYMFLVLENMKVRITVGFRQRRFVVLRYDLVFLLMGVLYMWNTLYYDEVYLYIFGFIKVWKNTSELGLVTEDSWFCVMVVFLL